MIINDLDDYYIVFDTKNRNTELDTLQNNIRLVQHTEVTGTKTTYPLCLPSEHLQHILPTEECWHNISLDFHRCCSYQLYIVGDFIHINNIIPPTIGKNTRRMSSKDKLSIRI